MTDPASVWRILSEQAAAFVLPDTHEAGGIWPCVKIGHLCEAAGVPVIMHCGHDLGPKTAAMLHVAAACPAYSLANDSAHQLVEDITCEPLTIRHGRIAVPDRPGLGIEGDESAHVRRRLLTVVREAALPARLSTVTGPVRAARPGVRGHSGLFRTHESEGADDDRQFPFRSQVVDAANIRGERGSEHDDGDAELLPRDRRGKHQRSPPKRDAAQRLVHHEAGEIEAVAGVGAEHHRPLVEFLIVGEAAGELRLEAIDQQFHQVDFLLRFAAPLQGEVTDRQVLQREGRALVFLRALDFDEVARAVAAGPGIQLPTGRVFEGEVNVMGQMRTPQKLRQVLICGPSRPRPPPTSLRVRARL